MTSFLLFTSLHVEVAKLVHVFRWIECKQHSTLQLTEEDLAAIARGGGPGIDPELADGAGGETTRRLLGNYDAPTRLPI